MNKELNLDEIEAELNEISPWPWSLEHRAVVYQEEEFEDCNEVCEVENENDRCFIAKGLQRLAAAVKRIRELEEAKNVLLKACKGIETLLERKRKSMTDAGISVGYSQPEEFLREAIKLYELKSSDKG